MRAESKTKHQKYIQILNHTHSYIEKTHRTKSETITNKQKIYMIKKPRQKL